MYVLCTGVFSSGLDWRFAVASYLVESGGRGEGAGVCRPDDLPLAEHRPDRLKVLKWDRPGSRSAALLAEGQAVALYGYRDLRDVVVAWLRGEAGTFEELIERGDFVQRCLDSDRFWRSRQNVLVQAYETTVVKPVATILDIARHLRLWRWGPEEASYLARRFPPATDDGGPGTWRNVLTPPQREVLADLCGDWLIQRGYERDYRWVQEDEASMPFASTAPTSIQAQAPRLRVLVVNNLYPPGMVGGYELNCKHMSDTLRKRGHTVRVLVSRGNSPDPDEPHVRRVLKLAPVYDIEAAKSRSFAESRLVEAHSTLVCPANVRALIDEIQEFRPDVVYLWLLTGLGGLAIVATVQALGLPWVWQLGGEMPWRTRSTLSGPIRSLTRMASRWLQGHYLARSQIVVDENQKAGFSLQDTVDFVPCWVMGERTPPRAEYLQDGVLRVVQAGRVLAAKGCHLVVQAASLLRARRYTDFSIDFIGEVVDPRISEMIPNLGVQDNVRTRGYIPQEQLLRLYPDYDIFTFPTFPREAFGAAPLEAAGVGCVPVMSRICGIAEHFEDGLNCIKVDRNAEAIANTLANIMDGKVDLKRLGQAASDYVWREFHIDVIAPIVEGSLAAAAARPRAQTHEPRQLIRLADVADELIDRMIREAEPARTMSPAESGGRE